MQPITVQVSSITVAMRGKKLLEKYGIRSYMTRTTQDDGENGCGYSLLVYASAQRVQELFQVAGIRIRGIRRGDRL